MLKKVHFLIRKNEIDAILQQIPIRGKHALPVLPLTAGNKCVPFNIIEDVEMRDDELVAELHTKESDLVYCLEGEIIYVYGGQMINPKQLQLPDGSVDKNNLVADNIQGGITVIIYPGDWLLIPSNEPHMHMSKNMGRIMVIKIPDCDQQ